MNPFTAGPAATETTADALPELKEYAWDFVHDCFLYDQQGRHKEVTENEALKVWIYKALKTERYRYAAYRHGRQDLDCPYGVELERFIGRRTNNKKTATEVQQYVREALLVNPYIVRIDNIQIIEISKDRLTLNIVLTSVYGKLTQEVKI